MSKRTGMSLFIIILVMMIVGCKKNSPTDEEKIRAVIEKQIQAFHAGSLEGEEQVWSHTPYVVRMTHYGFRATGWDSIKKLYLKYLPKEPVKDFKFSLSNYHSHISGNTAWVTNDQVTEGIMNGQAMDQNKKAWDVRILEKEQDDWKIVFHVTGPATAGK